MGILDPSDTRSSKRPLRNGMCQEKDNDIRPIHRARIWQLCARRMEKERRGEAWYTTDGTNSISAPLIISPTAGDLTAKIRALFDKYFKTTYIKVATRMRDGNPIMRDHKSEPFRRYGCLRHTCLVCRGVEPGKCERNRTGYRIKCVCSQTEGKKAI